MSSAASEPFRSHDPEAPLERAVDGVEQWLLWEEQANLIGFRVTTRPMPIEVACVARGAVSVEAAADLPEDLARRFLRGDSVLFPRHPLNRDPAVAFADAPVAERWVGRATSSRTLVVPVAAGQTLFSLKLPTDHPHPDFRQPEKTRLRDEARDALRWVSLLARVERLLGPEPGLRVVREALVVLVPGSESGFVVRDLRLFQDGSHYLPALSIPWVGRQIARLHRAPFDAFWGRHYAEAVGRAKAALLARSGLQFETPNPQNVLVQLDAALRPTGAIVVRDLGDADCATDAPTCRSVPWTRLLAPLRPETRNSFWAFEAAGDHAVPPAVLDVWAARHDAAYFAELGRRFPALAPAAALAPEARAGHWSRALSDPASRGAVATALRAWS